MSRRHLPLRVLRPAVVVLCLLALASTFLVFADETVATGWNNNERQRFRKPALASESDMKQIETEGAGLAADSIGIDEDWIAIANAWRISVLNSKPEDRWSPDTCVQFQAAIMKLQEIHSRACVSGNTPRSDIFYCGYFGDTVRVYKDHQRHACP